MAEAAFDETPELFGPRRSLVGVLTTPRAGPRLGCVLSNAGILHRIGPHRLNVKLARALAASGVATLRFDLSGVGDSAADVESGADHRRSQRVLDMQAAMDRLRSSTGVERFIAVGICSGAVDAYELALRDDRIAGIFMFDGFAFPTWKTHLNRRWLRLRQMARLGLLSQVAMHLKKRLARHPDSAAGLFASGEPSQTPSREAFRAAMDRLVARGTSCYLAYSGSFVEVHNYAGQLADAFRGAAFLRRIGYFYRPDIDHTLTALSAQRSFIACVVEWASGLAEA